MERNEMVVFLFDIDGTLIKTGGAGGAALMEAFAETFGVADPAQVPFSGRTDRGIAQNLFRVHDVEDTPDNWRLLCDVYLKRLRHYLPLRQGEVLPGVHRLLDQLAQHADVALGLLTGNAREGARLKLEHYELWHHFSFGGYGDHHVNRDEVAQAALAACRAYVDGDVGAEQIWVVGDTPLDIRCARAIGARVVAVATGWDDRRRLEAARPDLLFDDLMPTEAILEHTLLDAV
jgi:phosphoglycolate phosphatase-like HAD superfamily hydrolase